MVKKTRSARSNRPKKRHRRTPEEIIADLQEEIRRVRDRARQRELKSSPVYKTAIAAVKALDKALDAAAEAGDGPLRHALGDARKGLGAYLEGQGAKLPKANLPRGRRPRASLRE